MTSAAPITDEPTPAPSSAPISGVTYREPADVLAALKSAQAIVRRLPHHLPTLLLGHSREAYDVLAAMPGAVTRSTPYEGKLVHAVYLRVGELEAQAIYTEGA